jgi:hypothetical protein
MAPRGEKAVCRDKVGVATWCFSQCSFNFYPYAIHVLHGSAVFCSSVSKCLALKVGFV